MPINKNQVHEVHDPVRSTVMEPEGQKSSDKGCPDPVREPSASLGG